MKLTKGIIREIIREVLSEADDDKYTHIGYGKYKEKGKEKDKDAPIFKKTDSGKYVSPDKDTGAGNGDKEQTPQQPPATKKITDISDNPFEDEEEEKNESLITKIKEEVKKYEI